MIPEHDCWDDDNIEHHFDPDSRLGDYYTCRQCGELLQVGQERSMEEKRDDIISINVSKKAVQDTIGFLSALIQESLDSTGGIDEEFAVEIKSRTIAHLVTSVENYER